MKAAFSPCPNDTFIFHAWVSGLLGDPIEPVYLDIEELNRAALAGTYPLSKVSFGCLGDILDEYVMLPVGAALGHGCGPKIVAKEWFPLDELPEKTIAIPGLRTTAHLLLQLLAPEPKVKLFCRYDQTLGAADCALIIHEQRFTYEQLGYVEIADLGALWDGPIPLGGLVAKRSLGGQTIKALVERVTASLAEARRQTPFTYILEHSQEKDPTVVKQHIDLYVNEETTWLSEAGKHAVERLINPKREKPWLFA